MSTDFEEMFELAPVSLWLEDYSALHLLFERWRAAGITDLRRYLIEDTARVAECSRQLKVLSVGDLLAKARLNTNGNVRKLAVP